MSPARSRYCTVAGCLLAIATITGIARPPLARAQTAERPSGAAVQDGSTRPSLNDAFNLLKEKRLTEAERAFRALIEANAKEIGAYVGLGECLSAQGRLKEAAEAYRQAVALNPAAAEIRAGLGRVLETAGDTVGALSEYEQATGLAPWNPRYHLALAEVYRRLGRLPEARDSCVRALGLNPNDADVHVQMGAIHEDRQEWDAAIASYEAAQRLAGDVLAPTLGVLSALNGAGRFAEVERRCRELLKASPGSTELRMTLAVALDGQGRHDEAETLYRELLQEQPQAAALWGNLGWCLYQSGKLDEALQASQRALELDPKLAFVLYNAGLFHALKGNGDAAHDAYQKAMATGTRSDLRAALQDVRNAMERTGETPVLVAVARMLEGALRQPATTINPLVGAGK